MELSKGIFRVCVVLSIAWTLLAGGFVAYEGIADDCSRTIVFACRFLFWEPGSSAWVAPDGFIIGADADPALKVENVAFALLSPIAVVWMTAIAFCWIRAGFGKD
jgi:hypothetical protein